MHNVISYDAARKRRKKGAFEMAREAVKVRIGKDRALSVSAKLVGMRLTDFINRKYYVARGELDAWPSEQTLAELTGMSERTIRRRLRDLEKAGHLVPILFGSNYARRTSRYRMIHTQDVRLPMKENKILPFRTEQAFSPSTTSKHEQAARGVR